jgi:putative DNA primase/helicase
MKSEIGPESGVVGIEAQTLRTGMAGGDAARQEFGQGWGLDFTEIEPWPEPVEGKALLDELSLVLSRFVVLPKWAAETLALWCLHTYAFEARDVTTYLGIESPEKRCGKTTLLTVLSELVNRPVVAANISPPAFFRVIEEARPTLLIDEADRASAVLRGPAVGGTEEGKGGERVVVVAPTAAIRDPAQDAVDRGDIGEGI